MCETWILWEAFGYRNPARKKGAWMMMTYNYKRLRMGRSYLRHAFGRVGAAFASPSGEELPSPHFRTGGAVVTRLFLLSRGSLSSGLFFIFVSLRLGGLRLPPLFWCIALHVIWSSKYHHVGFSISRGVSSLKKCDVLFTSKGSVDCVFLF